MADVDIKYSRDGSRYVQFPFHVSGSFDSRKQVLSCYLVSVGFLETKTFSGTVD
jgi:hypothetical protein